MVLKCFGRKFVRSFRTKATKDSCDFASILETKGPNSWKQNLKKKEPRKIFFWRVLMKKLFDYAWKPIIPFFKFFLNVYCLWCSTLSSAIVVFWMLLMEPINAVACWWPCSCRKCDFRLRKLEENLNFLRFIHVFDLMLKYCSDIKEGIGIQLQFYSVRLVDRVASFKRMSILHLWVKFYVEDLLYCTFIETSASGFRNWFDLERIDFGVFFVGICLVLSTSYLHGLKFPKIDQIWLTFDEIKSSWMVVWGVFWSVF